MGPLRPILPPQPAFERVLPTDAQRTWEKKLQEEAKQQQKNKFFSEDMLRDMQNVQRNQAIIDNNNTIKRLQEEGEKLRGLLAASQDREKKALEMLRALVEGLRSTDLEIPGYDDAMAFFVQEKMLSRGGGAIDINVGWDGNVEKIFKL